MTTRCKQCGKVLHTTEGIIIHFLFVEKKKLNKNMILFFIKNCFVANVIKGIFAGLLFVLWVITFPFALVNEKIQDTIDFFNF